MSFMETRSYSHRAAIESILDDAEFAGEFDGQVQLELTADAAAELMEAPHELSAIVDLLYALDLDRAFISSAQEAGVRKVAAEILAELTS
jgi:hypothetical protein